MEMAMDGRIESHLGLYLSCICNSFEWGLSVFECAGVFVQVGCTGVSCIGLVGSVDGNGIELPQALLAVMLPRCDDAGVERTFTCRQSRSDQQPANEWLAKSDGQTTCPGSCRQAAMWRPLPPP